MGCSCKGYRVNGEYHETLEANNSEPIIIQRPKKVDLFIVNEEESHLEQSNIASCIHSKRQSLASVPQRFSDHFQLSIPNPKP
jgi:hypothetical protein